MKPPRTRKQIIIRNSLFSIVGGAFLLACLTVILWFWQSSAGTGSPYAYVATIAGIKGEFGEPFGIAVKGSDVYVSDGQSGKIWRINGGTPTVFAYGLDTPSAIAFDKAGNLIVADSGSNTIRSISPKGEVATIAGVENRSGFADGDAANAMFNAPIGVAVGSDGKIFVADTYNDRIRVIDGGTVSTLAGSSWGYADGLGTETKFDTPCGIAVWQDKLLVADTGNRRIRVVEMGGRVWTLAGNGDLALKDGLLLSSSFVQPTAVTVDKNGSIFIADGNAIRQIGGQAIPIVSTISNSYGCLRDGDILRSRFDRPSGLAVDGSGELLIADSENRLLRRFSSTRSGNEIAVDEIAAFRDKPEEFRIQQPARWPYDPPNAKREIAGTLGEIRGEIPETAEGIHFHNGLDIAGAYGETARFVRDEKVLRPVAAENFGTLRESIRMPTMGYIHIRLGRNVSGIPFGDGRFQFERGRKRQDNRRARARVAPKFKAGEPIGTLNPMNHVHLIAGRSGSEMNALDALILPNLTDTRPPTIEKVSLFDEDWHEIETRQANPRIRLSGKTRIVVRAYDQVDGNSERRRLGVYQIGYQLLRPDNSPVGETKWTIKFDRMPASQAVKFAYAAGSKSGATGETIFNYIATNYVEGDDFREDFLDAATLAGGIYTLRVFAADQFGNTSSKDVSIEVLK